MRQTELMVIALNMQPGQAYQLSRNKMLGCADGMLKSAFDGPPRQEDIDNFIESVKENWRVDFSYDPYNDRWTMHKLGNT